MLQKYRKGWLCKVQRNGGGWRHHQHISSVLTARESYGCLQMSQKQLCLWGKDQMKANLHIHIKFTFEEAATWSHRRASNISTCLKRNQFRNCCRHKYGNFPTGIPNSFFCHVQCLHSVLHPWIPTLQTSRSVRGETACGSAWAASPACRPAG